VSDKIQLSGIFENGYGIVPKKLMKMKFDNKIGKQRGKNVKLVLCYLLSYSGSGASAFPSIRTISDDLEISRPTVIEAIKNAEELSLISIGKNIKENGSFANNVYQLDFLLPDSEHTEKTTDGTEFTIKTYGGKATLPGVVKPIDQGGQTGLPGVVKSLDSNNNNTIITYNNKDKPTYNKDVIESTNHLYYQIMDKVNPPTYKNRQPNLNKWCDSIDKLNRIDGIDFSDIRKAIDYATSDDFWSQNILSGEKLRKHYNKIYVKMKSENKSNPSSNQVR
jgi:hypothetical protein